VPYGAPVQAPDGGPVCRFCGGFPAAQVTVRGHRGMIVIMQFLRQPGPFCRTCGTATVRDMSARTLYQGWWGYLSSVFTPITLLRNLFAYNKIKALPPATAPRGPQLDPGKPLTRRPAMLMLLLPVAAWTLVIGVFIAAALSDGGSDDAYTPPYRVPTSLTVSTGDCVHNTGTSAAPALKVLPCSDPTADYKVLARVPDTTDDTTACEPYPTTESSLTHEETGNNFVLCLAKNRTSTSTAGS
jgi:hypothetical protein